jgi:hypothetical protein
MCEPVDLPARCQPLLHRAVAYLGIKRGSLYKHTSARTVPFGHGGPGCRLWFLRSELDASRLSGGVRRRDPRRIRTV